MARRLSGSARRRQSPCEAEGGEGWREREDEEEEADGGSGDGSVRRTRPERAVTTICTLSHTS